MGKYNTETAPAPTLLLLLRPHHMTYTYTTHIYLIAALITYIHTYTPSYSYSYMYTHMLTYHTYSTTTSQPRIHWQIPLYQYAYNDLSDMIRDQLQISPNTPLHIHMQIAQPHTATHTCHMHYICVYACMCVLYLLC